MDIGQKIIILDRIYEVYDQVLSRTAVACKRHCSVCCTVNVTLTSLEGMKILDYLRETGQADLVDRLVEASGRRRFVPKTTINQLAGLCIRGEEIPEEEIDPAWGPCPFLSGDECPVYPARPFMCRCMVSEVRCRQGGWAQLDPFALSVNDVFMQVIEHVDAGGVTGNLSNVLLYLSSGSMGSSGGTKEMGLDAGVISNSPIPALMIPPEFREKLVPIQEAIVACARGVAGAGI